jgi:hypothetical protein
MQLPIDQLLRGIILSLNETILPELSSPYAQVQATAISSILENLIIRILHIHRIQREQNNSLKDIFHRLATIISDYKDSPSKENLRSLLAEINQQERKGKEAELSLEEENFALKLLLEKVIEKLWEIEEHDTQYPIEALEEIHKSIRRFLKQEVKTELSLLASANIAEVSKAK